MLPDIYLYINSHVISFHRYAQQRNPFSTYHRRTKSTRCIVHSYHSRSRIIHVVAETSLKLE